MGYKKTDSRLSFADIALFSSLDRNRAIQRMEKINKVVNWSKIEHLVVRGYAVGKSAEGGEAYHPLLLLKCLLLQQWFRIDSDPELENQINDRISFKKFLGLSFDRPSPDHSTFSRFRSRLSKDAMRKINSVVLQQFSQKGLTINEGVAVDARLVQSASRPIGKESIEEERQKRQSPEGVLDKGGNTLKFSRDLDSDWTVRNGVPHYGLKEHAAVDILHGLVLSTEITPASVHDSTYLPYSVAGSCHTGDPIRTVYADKGYFGEPNRAFLQINGIGDGIMRKATRSTKLTEYERQRNREISGRRYIVEQYFGLSHLHCRAFRARFTRIVKNAIDALFRQIAFNLFRGMRIFGTA